MWSFGPEETRRIIVTSDPARKLHKSAGGYKSVSGESQKIKFSQAHRVVELSRGGGHVRDDVNVAGRDAARPGAQDAAGERGVLVVPVTRRRRPGVKARLTPGRAAESGGITGSSLAVCPPAGQRGMPSARRLTALVT